MYGHAEYLYLCFTTCYVAGYSELALLVLARLCSAVTSQQCSLRQKLHLSGEKCCLSKTSIIFAVSISLECCDAVGWMICVLNLGLCLLFLLLLL